MMERAFSSLLIAGEYHTDYPEEDNIISGYQYISRIEILQILCVLRPAQGRERPQCRGEPGVQRIRILRQMLASAFRANLRCCLGYNDLTAVITVVSRYPMSPPELSGNTPVTDILQPVQVNLVKTLRNKGQIAIFDRFDGRLCHLFHLHEPLLFDHRLYGSAAAVMSSYIMNMVYHFYQQSLCIKISYHSFSCLITIHAVIFAARAVDGGIIMHDIDLSQVMTSSYLEIVRVMSRRDLYAAGSELFVYIRVSDHRDFSVCQWKLQSLSDEVFVSVIIRIDCHCRITKQSLRTGGCDLHITTSVSNRIIDVPEMSSLLLMLYLCIRDGRMTYRTPVNDSGTFVDVSFLIETGKYFQNCLRASFIHGETLSVPVTGGTNLL